MKVTLAMGLQYEHSPKHPPTQGREDFSAHLKPTDNIIDVEPIKPKSSTVLSMSRLPKTFAYITYNETAGLVFIPQIGTQLDMKI